MSATPSKAFVVPTSTPLVLDCRERVFAHALSLIIKAGSGGTMVVEISNSALAVEDPSNPANIWAPSGAGTIPDTAPQEVVRYAPCNAIRITAAGANGIVEAKG